MKAMILAAGFGTRLLPATRYLPKPCFPLMNRPVIAHIIDNLKGAGVREIVINLHHLPEKVKETVESCGFVDMKIHFSYEDEILGTAGGIKKVEELLRDDTFILHNGDIFSSTDLKEAADFHLGKKAADVKTFATMILKEGTHPAFIGLDEDLRITRFPYGATKAHEGYIHKTFFTGIHILEPSVFNYIPEDEFYGINAKVYPDMLRDGYSAFGYLTGENWCDIGTPEDFLGVNFHLLDKKETVARADDARSYSLINPSLIGNGAVIEEGCTIGPYALIGDRCIIKRDSRIENSVVLSDTVISESTILKNSMVLNKCVIRGLDVKG